MTQRIDALRQSKRENAASVTCWHASESMLAQHVAAMYDHIAEERNEERNDVLDEIEQRLRGLLIAANVGEAWMHDFDEIIEEIRHAG